MSTPRIVLSIISLLALSACQTVQSRPSDCPSFIVDSLMNSEIKTWKRLSQNIDQIVATARKFYTDNGIWPNEMKQAEKENRLSIYVFKGGDYYAVYWVCTKQSDNLIEHTFESYCFHAQTHEVLFSGPGTIMLFSPHHEQF